MKPTHSLFISLCGLGDITCVEKLFQDTACWWKIAINLSIVRWEIVHN